MFILAVRVPPRKSILNYGVAGIQSTVGVVKESPPKHLPSTKHMTPTTLPMFFSNLHLIYVNPIDKPSLSLLNEQIVPTHHSLTHFPFCIKRPILKPIAPLPQHTVFCVLILVPELHSDLTVAKRK